jgi:peptide/nickel transport system permease protein
MLPAAGLAVLVLSAFGAPWIAAQNPYDLVEIRLEESYLPPVWSPEAGHERERVAVAPGRFLLGTDAQGRDVLSSVLFGLRVSLLVGLSGTAISLGFGMATGLAAGYFRGRWDAVLMRLADIQLSFPSVLIALFLMAVWGQGLGKIVLAVGIVHWVIYARIARGLTLVEREKDYIAAIRSLGAGAPRIVLRHLAPNVVTPLLVVSVLQFASVVILEATLSYLGLGVPITRPSLGMLIKFGYDEFFSGHWWVWFFPGLALVLLMLCLNWLADILRAERRLSA